VRGVESDKSQISGRIRVKGERMGREMPAVDLRSWRVLPAMCSSRAAGYVLKQICGTDLVGADR